ncbi:MAG: hydantoinase/oxoprolinase family protein [Beijerinckiaceae bacterium]
MQDCRLAVDIGGTFTDIVLEHPGGKTSGKVLTTPEAPEKGVASGIAQVLRQAGAGPDRVSLVVHGTTLATNAIIERRGAKTALLTTKGFRDTLAFAYGHRFDQYDLSLTRPEPLIDRSLRLEADERMAADGSVLRPLDEAALRATAADLRARGIKAVAVCFLHAYANGAHEARAREILLAEAPGLYVSLSHEVCPEIREYERTSTTVSNAYVQPLMAGYLGKLGGTLQELGIVCPLLLITSAGSLTSIDTAIRFPIRLVESGPAGGAIFSQHVARELGAREAIALDMGGTTAKIVLVNDFEPRHSRAMEVARAHRFLPGSGIPLRIPVIDLIEIGAGGGSIAHVDALRQIAVGPESAGSVPGPACYGLGGSKPSVTDADLVLGKLDPSYFAGGRMKLDSERAKAAVDDAIGAPLGFATDTAAAGITEIVDENMSNAIRVHAADYGDRVETRTLVATGGAAPLHAARIAQKLGIPRVVVPAGAGVGSAHGFLQAPVAYQAVRSRVVSLREFDAGQVNAIFDELRGEAEAVLRLASPGRSYTERRFSDMRYQGQGHDLSVEIPARRYGAEDGQVLQERFLEVYRKYYSRTIPNLAAQALTWTLILSLDRPATASPAPLAAGSGEPPVKAHTSVFDAGVGGFVEAKVYDRAAMPPGCSFAGPALVVEEQTTTYAPPGFAGSMTAGGHLVLDRSEAEGSGAE